MVCLRESDSPKKAGLRVDGERARADSTVSPSSKLSASFSSNFGTQGADSMYPLIRQTGSVGSVSCGRVAGLSFAVHRRGTWRSHLLPVALRLRVFGIRSHFRQ
jgi:hypothetical protein